MDVVQGGGISREAAKFPGSWSIALFISGRSRSESIDLPMNDVIASKLKFDMNLELSHFGFDSALFALLYIFTGATRGARRSIRANSGSSSSSSSSQAFV